MQREAAGTKSLALELPRGATVDDAWRAVVREVPALAPGRQSLRFAVNGSYADEGDVLDDGDELACIPPVSGGAGQPPAARILRISAEPLPRDLASTLADELATDEDGGVVAFTGRTRVTPGTPAPGQEAEAARHAGRVVDELEYEAFEPMALDVLAGIADEIEARFGVSRLAIVHRTGRVPLGDASIVVVAVAPHRGAAFDAARYAIDETKARAPIWKAERFEDGVVWIGDVARTGPDEPG
jgi:molybdopterin synthase catalytic subunit